MRIAILLVATTTIGLARLSAPGVGQGSTTATAETTQPIEVSAVKRKRARVHRARPRPATQIACTRYGCRPIPAGCRIEAEYNPFTWDPSGFDAVVCPGR